MAITPRYNPAEVEDKWYKYWLSKDYFHSVPDERESFSIVIPPPNVTGVLHMGHMLNNTIQDILIRKARQDGKNACWVPGTDHASIATEAKVVKMLKDKGIRKADLRREEFLKYAWEWTNEYGGIILQQLQKLGASCDWERTAFTMDKIRSEAVSKVFVDLYRKGKLYRGNRMVNWDPEAKTVLSNEEVIYSLEQSKIYYVRYQVDNSEEFITVATTRPETIPGDTAIAVHPEDPRYQHLKDKYAVIPVIGRVVPIIFDTYVDMEFGTGALKVTPAHDVNDYEIGKRHNLQVIDVFNDDGTMSTEAKIYTDEDRFVVRKKFVKDLDAENHIVKIEDYQNNIGRSERTNCIIEPKLSLQWYVDMKSLADPALEAVMNDQVAFFPKNQKNIYRHWMENIRDWCISRQLWWGHRIPAWYYGEGVFVAETAEEALTLAQNETGNFKLTLTDLREDEDVLDTWFSSWLWPISVFDGFNDKKELDYYYPTSVLVTGWDIIFLWVARMIMAGYEWQGKKPFHHVYFTGMVKDKQRRKMSKQLGNSPDALKLIEEFGADGVRFGMMSCSPAGGDLLFDEKLCEQGRNFCNKMWNALRLIEAWETDKNIQVCTTDALAYEWMENKLLKLSKEVEQNFEEYRLSEALISIYSFVWNDFCSWYLEIIKPDYESKISNITKQNTLKLYKNICSLVHPFMPFITEEIWHIIRSEDETSDCILSPYPKSGVFDQKLVDTIETAKDIITNVRDIRNKNGIKMKELLKLSVLNSENANALFIMDGLKELVIKMANLSEFSISDDDTTGIAFISGTDKFFVAVHTEIDIQAQLDEKRKELDYQKGFVRAIEGKLSNDKFVSSAPEAIVDRERKKLEDGQERIKMLSDDIERLTLLNIP